MRQHCELQRVDSFMDHMILWWRNNRNIPDSNITTKQQRPSGPRWRSSTINVLSLLRVLQYIHENPVKAGLCDRPEAYPWSSASGMWEISLMA